MRIAYIFKSLALRAVWCAEDQLYVNERTRGNPPMGKTVRMIRPGKP